MRTIIKLCFYLFLLLLAIFIFACELPDAQVTLILSDKNGLQEGDPVYYRDIQIGRVASFDLLSAGQQQPTYFSAQLHIDREKMQYLYREMHFRVERVRPLLAPRKVTIYDNMFVADRTSLRQHDLVVGKTGTEHLLDETLQLLEEVAEETKPIRERIKNRVIAGIRNLVDRLNVEA